MKIDTDSLSNNFSGLSDFEALAKLKMDGPNALPSAKRRSILNIASKIITEPMFLLLIGCGFLYFVLGNFHEACILISFVFVIMGITLYQENKTEKALTSLKNLSSPRALVIRSGIKKRIAGFEVVKDDLIVIHEGDYVPADSLILYANNLFIEESLLTGESVPVNKTLKGDNKVYASTLVTHGFGIAKVYATGIDTEIGKIGKALQNIEPEQTLLQRMTMKLVRTLAIVGLSICVLVAFIYGVFNNDNWLNGILAGITLAMAILPEEIPVILTTFLAIGSWRISKAHVLTRRVPAIEALGAANVLCVDKTGTLTINDMQVKELFANKNGKTLLSDYFDKKPFIEDFRFLIETSLFAIQKEPFDPMEKAIKVFSKENLNININELYNNYDLIHEYPLSEKLFAVSHVWRFKNKDRHFVVANGSPEAIFSLSHLDEKEKDRLFLQLHAMANKGLRVIGIAKAEFETVNFKLPEEQHAFDFKFVGFIGLENPIRETVPNAIQKCYRAGIRVVMITGDYPETAVNIGKKIALMNTDDVLVGSQLKNMSDSQFRDKIKEVDIFARIVPEQKLRIVNALKASGDIVAMTGDGVNDAPALKAAHIGVAMGKYGTDVARDASELVLLDDDFSSIVESVGLGRRIFDNIKKAISYTLSVHIPIIGISLLPLFLKLPLILLPIRYPYS